MMQFTGKSAADLPRRVASRLSFALFGALVSTLAFAAEPPPADPATARQAEFADAMKAATAAMKAGPTEVQLLDQAQFKVPTDDVFVPMPQAGRLFRAMGNQPDASLAGLVLPKDDASEWMAVIRYEKSGYVKDDEAKNWDVDDLFKSIKEGTDASNEERRKRGFPELVVTGWVEKPRYDATSHRLVWSMGAKQMGESGEGGVNYNTYALGRDGFFSINFITGRDRIDPDKPIANGLLAGLDYRSGKRYADFDVSSDRVAEFGIAALVAGVAAKKLGLIALFAAFAVKWAKILLIGGVAVLAAVKRFLKRGPPTVPPPAPPGNPPGSDPSAG